MTTIPMRWAGSVYLKRSTLYIRFKGLDGRWTNKATPYRAGEEHLARALLRKVREATLKSVSSMDTTRLRALKTSHRRAGALRCEVCGWSPPAIERVAMVMHSHHIVPRAYGGTNAPSNLVLLCPNHHAIVHSTFITRRRSGVYDGPRTREELIALLQLLDRDPLDFLRRVPSALVREFVGRSKTAPDVSAESAAAPSPDGPTAAQAHGMTRENPAA